MIDLKNFISAIAQIEEEKGISREVVLETIEMALAAAYKKDYGQRGQMIRAKLDPENGEFKLWQEKIVVDEDMIKSEEEIEAEREQGIREDEDISSQASGDEEPRKVRFNEEKHIMIDEARRIDKKVKPGDVMNFDLETRADFGRIAAQTAKQVIIQRIREAERNAVFAEYENKVDQIISGIVQRIEGNYIFFDIGKATSIMVVKDRMPNEHYRIGTRMRLYLASIEQGPKGPQMYVSRTHPKMLSRLFELEVPEISAGSVVIKAVAREPGFRSKIAVTSTEEGIDPIGSCVGQRGTRVAAVIQELSGEKIDIIEWKEDPEEFVAAALSPAKVLSVEADKGRARVTVAEDQLSLAIGKDGQNVRLAAKLTGWKIDIVSRESGGGEESVDASGVESSDAEGKGSEEKKDKKKKSAKKEGSSESSVKSKKKKVSSAKKEKSTEKTKEKAKKKTTKSKDKKNKEDK